MAILKCSKSKCIIMPTQHLSLSDLYFSLCASLYLRYLSNGTIQYNLAAYAS